MKDLKMLGLAAIAALGLMAFVGAGWASATTLSTDAVGFATYGAGTEIHASLKSSTSATLEKTNGELIATCTTSTVVGSIDIETGTWVSESIQGLTWGDPEGTHCSQRTQTLAKGSVEIMQFGTEDKGTVRGRGSEVTVQVFGVSCVYGTGEGTTLGTITGGAAPVLTINAILPRISGSSLFCPGTGRWTAEYVVTSPHEVHFIG